MHDADNDLMARINGKDKSAERYSKGDKHKPSTIPSHSKTTVQRNAADNLSDRSVNLRNYSYYRSYERDMRTHRYALISLRS